MTSLAPLNRSSAFALTLIACVVVGVAVVILGPGVLPTALMRDFNAFYCAGHALDVHADPYLAEPLGACERVAHGFGLQSGMRGLAMPAPLPPYALAPFALLARLRYPVAALFWTIVIALAVTVTVVAMRRITRLPWAALIAALALTDGYAAACLGQIAPVSIAAIAVAAAYAEAGMGELAGFAAALAMIEPHLGIAACLGLFVRVGAARLPLLACALALAALSFTTAGVERTLEYARRVVPAHALSEVVNEKQFSLTHVLYQFGVSESAALRAGEIQFVCFVVVGVGVGYVLAARFRSTALAIVVPSAFAVIGGPFMHIVQMAVATLAGLVLYSKIGSLTLQRVLALALVALAIPWIQFVNLGAIFPLLAALVAGVLTWTLFASKPVPLAAIAIATLLYIIELEALIVERLHDPVPSLVRGYDPRALAEQSWTLYIHLVATPNAAAYEMAKAPTFFGALAIGIVALLALRERGRRNSENRKGI